MSDDDAGASLNDYCDANQRSLSRETPSDFRFRYIDLSSVDEGTIDWRKTRALSYADSPSRARRIVQPGDVLFSTVRPGLLGHAIVREPADLQIIGSTGFAVLSPKAHVDGRFLFHSLFLDQFKRQVAQFEVGSNYPAINESDLLRVKLGRVDGRSQKLIADILDAVDAAIVESDALIAKLVQVHQGLVHDLTTLGLDGNGEIRRKNLPNAFRPTALGLLPVGWRVDSLGGLANDLALGTGARGATEGKAQIRLLKMGNLGWDDINTASCELIDVERVANWKDSLLRDGDLLFNTRNTPELVGKTAAYNQDDQNTVADNNVLRVRFPEKDMDGRFAAAYMANGLGKARLLSLATGTTSVAAIYWRDLREFKLPVPSREEREEIVQRLQMSRDRIHVEKQVHAKLSDLREGLRDDLLTGRKSVVVLREAAE